jgi:hypothetical protein
MASTSWNRRAHSLVRQQIEPQAQAGQRGLQVMADRGQNLGAFLHGFADALLHLVEGGKGLAHVARAGFGNGGAAMSLEKPARRRPGAA